MVAKKSTREDIEETPAPEPEPVEDQPKIERIEEDLGIGVRDPYPTGNPPQKTHAEINGLVGPEGKPVPDDTKTKAKGG